MKTIEKDSSFEIESVRCRFDVGVDTNWCCCYCSCYCLSNGVDDVGEREVSASVDFERIVDKQFVCLFHSLSLRFLDSLFCFSRALRFACKNCLSTSCASDHVVQATFDWAKWTRTQMFHVDDCSLPFHSMMSI